VTCLTKHVCNASDDSLIFALCNDKGWSAQNHDQIFICHLVTATFNSSVAADFVRLTNKCVITIIIVVNVVLLQLECDPFIKTGFSFILKPVSVPVHEWIT